MYPCVQCFRDLRGIVQNDSITSPPISLHHVPTIFRGVFCCPSLALAPIVRVLEVFKKISLSLSLFYTFDKVLHDAFRRVDTFTHLSLHFDLSSRLACLDQKREYGVQHAFDHFLFAGFANRAGDDLNKNGLNSLLKM